MRTERTQLQHEVENLTQRLTQESLTLKDNLKGMFDDRKMAVRMEQRAMDSRIQELNYAITVSLNSDMKSEVEGLRWVLTRRAAMAIAIMAILILGSLRYTSYQIHLHDLAVADQRRKIGGGGGGGKGEDAGNGGNGGRNNLKGGTDDRSNSSDFSRGGTEGGQGGQGGQGGRGGLESEGSGEASYESLG